MKAEIRRPEQPYKPGDPCAIGRYLLGPYITGPCPRPSTHLIGVAYRSEPEPLGLGVCERHFDELGDLREAGTSP